jgi:hypothetical protein
MTTQQTIDTNMKKETFVETNVIIRSLLKQNSITRKTQNMITENKIILNKEDIVYEDQDFFITILRGRDSKAISHIHLLAISKKKSFNIFKLQNEDVELLQKMDTIGKFEASKLLKRHVRFFLGLSVTNPSSFLRYPKTMSSLSFLKRKKNYESCLIENITKPSTPNKT